MFRVSTALAFGALLVSSIPATAADTVKTVTFTKDVASIFQQKCESCHRPDNMAPMSLITYDEEFKAETTARAAKTVSSTADRQQ